MLVFMIGNYVQLVYLDYGNIKVQDLIFYMAWLKSRSMAKNLTTRCG